MSAPLLKIIKTDKGLTETNDKGIENVYVPSFLTCLNAPR